MRNLHLSTLVLVVAACGAYRFPPGSSVATGTVSGQVVAVPCAPVETAIPNCKPFPVSDLEIAFIGENGTVVGTKTDSGGAYSVQLDAGTWKVTLKNYVRIVKGPPTVTVTAGSNTVADYVVDSGIRVPLPQPGPPITNGG
jgi:hypothetical protein